MPDHLHTLDEIWSIYVTHVSHSLRSFNQYLVKKTYSKYLPKNLNGIKIYGLKTLYRLSLYLIINIISYKM